VLNDVVPKRIARCETSTCY